MEDDESASICSQKRLITTDARCLVRVQKALRFRRSLHPVHPLALTLSQNGWQHCCRVVILIFFHNKPSERRPYVFTGYSIENGLWNSVQKAPTPYGPTCTAISRLVANPCTILEASYWLTYRPPLLLHHIKCDQWRKWDYFLHNIIQQTSY